MHDDDEMYHDEEEGYDWNDGHPDHEGHMAVAQLHRLAKISKMLLAIFGKNDELEGWVQYKIPRAYNDMTDVLTHIQFEAQDRWVDSDEDIDDEEEFEEEEFEDADDDTFDADDFEEELDEAKKKKGLWANIHAKRKRGESPAKPGEKGYPDSKTWKKLTK